MLYEVITLLARTLRAAGFDVTFARNITDIDDKIINRSREAGISITELTDTYTEAYHRDMAALGVQRPTLEPKATESLEAMFDLIGKLLEGA